MSCRLEACYRHSARASLNIAVVVAWGGGGAPTACLRPALCTCFHSIETEHNMNRNCPWYTRVPPPAPSVPAEQRSSKFPCGMLSGRRSSKCFNRKVKPQIPESAMQVGTNHKFKDAAPFWRLTGCLLFVVLVVSRRGLWSALRTSYD